MKLHLSPSLHRALKTSFSLLVPIALTLSSSATTAPKSSMATGPTSGGMSLMVMN
ncbi:MAG: hypothetical protein R3Y56_09875 [Akkermansia sp.]